MDIEKLAIEQRDLPHEEFIPQSINDTHTEKMNNETSFEKRNEAGPHMEVFEKFVEYFCIKERIPFKELMYTVERNILIRALVEFNGNQKIAAKYLGIKYTTLHEKVKKYNIRFQKTPV